MNKSTLWTVLFLLTLCQLNAQDTSNLKKARYLIRKQNYQEALNQFDSAFNSDDSNIKCYDYYNAACCAAILEKPSKAFELLNKSVKEGYINKAWLNKDSDLQNLRNSQQWESLMKELDDELEELRTKLSKISNYDLSRIIPYKVNNLWGFLDKETLSPIIMPTFNKVEILSEKSELLYRETQAISINRSGDILEIFNPYGKSQDVELEVELAPDNSHFYSNDPNFKGFRLNQKNEIIKISKDFNYFEGDPLWNVQGPFEINNNLYVVAKKRDGHGIIDSTGNTLPGFEFVHDYLWYNHYGLSEKKWFLFQKNGKYGFINQNGKLKFNDLHNNQLHDRAGYQFLKVISDKDSFGIIDLTKMKWKLKPQAFQIIGISINCIDNCSANFIEKNHLDSYSKVLVNLIDDKKVELLFLVEIDNDQFYMNNKGVILKPQ